MPAYRITLVSLFLISSASIADQAQEPSEIIIPEIESRVEARVQAERANAEDHYVITPHRPKYILPAKVTGRRKPDSFDDIPDSDTINDVEFKMQFSFKYPLTTSLFGSKHSIWFAYTQQSFWQAYNNQASRPFRETNYEPEIFIAFELDFEVLGIDPKYLNISLNHQSNGRSEPTSRSWNRVMAEVIFEYDNLAFSVRPWWRLPESGYNDDNPDIHQYLGYGDLTAIYSWDEYSVDVIWRNNLHTSNNRGAIQIGFTFPLWNRFRGYVQYFNGYGESLVDYNYHTQSLGFGIILTSWL